MARGWGARLVDRARTRGVARRSPRRLPDPSEAPGPPPQRVETDVGVLLFPAHDQLMAPLIADQQGRWEIEEGDRLRDLLEPGMTFVDVGAHVGYMTLLGSRAVGPEGRVIAVEASPTNVELLRANVAANRAANVTIVAAAASDRPGHVTLSLSPWNSGDNRAYLVPEMERIEVPAVRLDDVVPADVRVDVVKLDTQGTDHRAVRGMAATLTRCRPVLVVEFWPPAITESGDDPVAVLVEYAAMGFDVRVLGQPEDGPAPTPVEIVQAAVSRHGEFCTLVLRPRC